MAITSDMQVKSAVLPDGKNKVKLTVGDGLYLLVNKTGKYWKYSYKYDGKYKDASLGVYPNVSLKKAKLSLQEIKQLLSNGIDPNQKKLELKKKNIEQSRLQQKQAEKDINTFEKIGCEWFETVRTDWVDSHASRQQGRLERHLYPHLGHIPISEIKRLQVVDALKSIQSPDIARRVSQLCKSILNYACNCGLIEAVPMGDMNKVLPSPMPNKMPAITDAKRLGELLRSTYAYNSGYVVSFALKILPLLAVRSGEFRMAEWNEFDLKAALWTIPASHRKLKKHAKADAKNVHLVPLSKQVVKLLEGLQEFTGRGRHVFPSVRGDRRPMSENTINVAYAVMGFKGEMVGHGWRSAFSTTLNQKGFNPDAIERQLSHGETNAVRAAYNRSDYMDERKTMMQAWSDYLDKLKALI